MYAKIFASLWDGSLRGERDAQLVFVYLLAHCDDEGVVEIIRDKIADDTGVGNEVPAELHEALQLLESPDANSRLPDFDGRRIVPLSPNRNWGWRIVNYEYYRKIRNELERKEQNRQAQHRARQKHASAAVSKRQQPSAESAQAEAEAEAEAVNPTHSGNVPLPMPVSGDVVKESTAQLRREWEGTFVDYFWPEYPRKVNRLEALKAWMKLGKGEGLPALEALAGTVMDGLKWYKSSEWVDTPTDKIPHASTWLNQRRFRDVDQAQQPTG